MSVVSHSSQPWLTLGRPHLHVEWFQKSVAPVILLSISRRLFQPVPLRLPIFNLRILVFRARSVSESEGTE